MGDHEDGGGRPVRGARRPRADRGHDRISSPELELLFQLCPGARAHVGIPGLHATIFTEAALVQRESDSAGMIRFPAPADDSMTTVTLNDPDAPDQPMASFWVVNRHGLPAAGGAAGVRPRLNLLGYAVGDEAATGCDAALEDAVLQFQADRRIATEGIRSRGRIETPHAGSAEELTEVPRDLGVNDTTRQAIVQQVTAACGTAPETSETFSSSALPVLRRRRVVLAKFVSPHDELFSDTPTDFPDIDDRGYTDAGHKGPWVGMITGRTIRVKLQRVDLQDDAPLYLAFAAGGPSMTVTPAGPVTGRTSTLSLQATSGTGHAILEVRFGRPTGPKIAEMRVEVHTAIAVDLALIRVRNAGGHDPTVDPDDQRTSFATLNAIFAPAGIEFTLRHNDSTAGPVPAIDASMTENAQLQRALTLRRYPRCLNIYVFATLPPCAAGAAAMGIPSSFGIVHEGAPIRGVVTSTAAFQSTGPRILAHEIGHVLGMLHPDQTTIRASTWAVRRLMFRVVSLQGLVSSWQPRGPRANVGTLLTFKDLHDPAESDGSGTSEDGEIGRLRAAAAHPYDGVQISGSS